MNVTQAAASASVRNVPMSLMGDVKDRPPLDLAGGTCLYGRTIIMYLCFVATKRTFHADAYNDHVWLCMHSVLGLFADSLHLNLHTCSVGFQYTFVQFVVVVVPQLSAIRACWSVLYGSFHYSCLLLNKSKFCLVCGSGRQQLLA